MGILRSARTAFSAAPARILKRSADNDAEPETQSESDLYFVALAQKGDKLAFRHLFERYQRRAMTLAFQIARSKEDAEDIVQDAFVRAYISLKDFKGESSFYTWLYRIVHNIAIDHKRRIQRRGGEALEYSEDTLGIGNKPIEEITTSVVQGGTNTSPLDNLVQKERIQKLRGALGELSEDHRAAVVLRELDGMSYDEIADVTGVAKGTVMSRLHYARKKIQEAFEDDD